MNNENILLTGSTGYLGSYLLRDILNDTNAKIFLLIRAHDVENALGKLWKSMQLHYEQSQFSQLFNSRIKIVIGDLSKINFGLDEKKYQQLSNTIHSIIHCAAAVNRKSEKLCLLINLKGTAEIIKLTNLLNKTSTFRRLSFVSTVAVSGVRKSEVLEEENTIDWSLKDFDPYGRTKKFAEYMIENFVDDPKKAVIFRPSSIIGDSETFKTSQFNMISAMYFLSKTPLIPVDKKIRLDIVPANYVSKCITNIHFKLDNKYQIYNLSSGLDSISASELTKTVSGLVKPIFIKQLSKPTQLIIKLLSNLPRKWFISRFFTLLDVFWPYMTYDTLYLNNRIIEETGLKPPRFKDYIFKNLTFAQKNKFKYPYQKIDLSLYDYSSDFLTPRQS